MSTAVQHAPLVSPDEYLASEIIAERKHEYVDGNVYLRDGQWAPEVLTAPESQIEFTTAGCALTVGEIYEGTGL